MRVLLITHPLGVYGGAEHLIVKFCEYLRKKNIQHAILTTFINEEIKKDLKDTRIIIAPLTKIPVGKLGLLNLKEIISLHKELFKIHKEFDIINAHNYPAEFVSFPYPKPIVWMCNEPQLYLNQFLEFPLTIKILNKFFFNLDKLIVKYWIKHVVVSDDFNAKRFKKIYKFKPYIIPYGIDFNFFSKEPQNKERIIKKYNLNGRFVVLQIGWFNIFKNQLQSVKIVNELKSKIPNIKLILAGEENNSYGKKVKGYVAENNLEKFVVFTGHLKREPIRDLYYNSSVLLHPIKAQGGWLSPFEALCANLPIITSEEMTASSIIKKENIGVVTNDFSQAILDVYNNYPYYKGLAEKGKEFVKNNLSWDNFCSNMLELFFKIIKK